MSLRYGWEIEPGRNGEFACGNERYRSHQTDRKPAGGFAFQFSNCARECRQPQQTDQPFGFNYTFESENYAKNAGNLLLVRPRVLGSKSSGVLETKEPRKFPLEFDGPVRDTDSFEIALPPGYEVDELPPPMDVDYSFGSYHSKTEASGQMLHYTRSMEIKELSVPVNKMDELKKFYRMIASDERNTAVLKPAGASK